MQLIDITYGDGQGAGDKSDSVPYVPSGIFHVDGMINVKWTMSSLDFGHELLVWHLEFGWQHPV